MEQMPVWLKFVTIMMAFAAVIVALPDLLRGVDALVLTWDKVQEIVQTHLEMKNPPPSPAVTQPMPPSPVPPSTPLPQVAVVAPPVTTGSPDSCGMLISLSRRRAAPLCAVEEGS